MDYKNYTVKRNNQSIDGYLELLGWVSIIFALLTYLWSIMIVHL